MAISSVEVLGSPKLTREGLTVRPDTRKATAVLAYLAVEGATRRDSLVVVFWPESDSSKGRANLRRTLSSARATLGESAIVTPGEEVDLGDAISSDFAEFRRLLEATTEHDHGRDEVCSRCIAALTDAANLYRGDFLDGFSLKDSPEFDDWARNTAERLRLECERVFERLATGLAGKGDYQTAIKTVNRWLDLDPLREPAYRQLMLLHGWAGDGAGATEAYRRCVANLDRELGVSPLEETTELLDAILDEDLPPAPGPRRRLKAKLDIEKSDDLIGRSHEVDVLAHCISGEITSLTISGDAWMGKTRLLDELRSMAGQRDRLTASARSFGSEQDLPYGVISQLLTELTHSPEWDSLQSEIADWALTEAARVTPGAGRQSRQEKPGAFKEVRMRDGLVGVLGASRALLIVDDLQWCDPASKSVLAQLPRHSEKGTVLVTAQRTELPSPIPERGEAHLTIELLPLAEAEIADSGTDLGPETVLRQTGGIPALVADIIATGDISDRSPGLRNYMEARLREVDELTRQVMTAASVLGGGFDYDDLRGTSGRSDEELLVAVESLLASRILTTADDGTLQFGLDAIEAMVYEESNQVRRRLLHRRAALTLVEHGGPDSDLHHATSIARHFHLGGQDRQASGWYRTAGDLAMTVFSPTEATTHFETALALGVEDPPAVQLRIGEAHLLSGRYTDALGDFEKAAALGDGEIRARAEHMAGETNRRLGRLDKALSQFELAESEHPEPYTLYCDWALASYRRRDSEDAIRLAEQAVSASDSAPGRARSRALTVLATVMDNEQAARPILNEALRLAGDDPMARVAALNALAFSEANRDHLDTAIGLVEDALVITESTGDRHRRAALYDHLANLRHRSGNRVGAETAQKEAVSLFAGIESGSWEPEVWLRTYW